MDSRSIVAYEKRKDQHKSSAKINREFWTIGTSILSLVVAMCSFVASGVSVYFKFFRHSDDLRAIFGPRINSR